MSWRVMVIKSKSKLDYKMDYLVIRTESKVSRVHLSEISVLLIESTAVSLTAYLLSELIKKKIIWAEIVRAKIIGQISNLPNDSHYAAELLSKYVSEIEAGDATNREAHAAKVYFNALYSLSKKQYLAFGNTSRRRFTI